MADVGGEGGVCLGATFTAFEEGDLLQMTAELPRPAEGEGG